MARKTHVNLALWAFCQNKQNYSLSWSVSVSKSLSAYIWILINWFVIFESFWVRRKITNQSAPKMPAVKRLKTSHLYRPCLILDTFTSNLLSWREKKCPNAYPVESYGDTTLKQRPYAAPPHGESWVHPLMKQLFSELF